MEIIVFCRLFNRAVECGSAFILPPGSDSRGVNFVEKTEKCQKISNYFILKNEVNIDQLHGF